MDRLSTHTIRGRQIDRRYREAPRNVILDGEASHTEPEPAFYEWAKACKADPDCIAVMQVTERSIECPHTSRMMDDDDVLAIMHEI